MKLLYHGPLWEGSTSLQRLEAFAALPGMTAVAHDTGFRVVGRRSLYSRVRWRLRWPLDALDENRRLLAAVETERPDAVFVDSSQVLSLKTLTRLKRLGGPALVYYTPDDIIASHNLSWPMRLSFPAWDVFFTTKTFNVPELRARGVRNARLIGKAYDAALHRPMTREEVGEEFERFDVVFIGTFEKERCESISRLGAAGVRVLVHTSAPERWNAAGVDANVTLRPAVYADDYTRVWHHGKLALCFLRKINRDRITQRTMEIAAIGRPMLAERTDEHDQHFEHDREYMGFGDDDDLVAKVKALLADEPRRLAMAEAGRARCLTSGYSTIDRAAEIVEAIRTSAPRTLG